MAGVAEPSPESIAYRLEVFIAVFTPLEVIAVALRFYARSLTVRKYDAGDWLIVAALIGQLVASGVALSSVKVAGVGQHAEYLMEHSPEKLVTFFKYLVIFSTWYATTEGLAKLAICILYKRIFTQQPRVIFAIHVIMFILVGASIGGGLADLFGCTPFSAHWGTPAEQAAHCIDTEALFVWGSFPNIVTDVALLVLPMPLVWNLQASFRLRAVLVGTFLFGSIGLITSILRFIAFKRKSSFIDPTYSAVELVTWTVCEPGVYLIAACLLVYRPLFEKMGFPLVISHSNRGKVDEESGGSGGSPFARGSAGFSKGSGAGAQMSIGGSRFSHFDDASDAACRKSSDVLSTSHEMDDLKYMHS